jgi:GNAT superfamily N-acetyltransferase
MTAVEPPVPDPALVRRLERATRLAWPPQETAACGGWLLRWSADVSHRTNSIVALDFPGERHLDEALDWAEGWYAARGRPCCFQVTDVSLPPELDARLAAAGYAMVTPSLVLTGRLDAPLEPLPLPPSLEIDLETRATTAVMQATSDPRWDSATRAARAALFARIRRPLAFCVAREGGEPAGGGLAVIVEGLAAISAMRTQTPHRGRGVAAAVLARLLQWARAMGAEQAFLQVEAANAPARSLYARAGFLPRYGYWYREQGPRDARRL